ncbi:GPN-loop GTPase 1-like [Pseudopipra pipra]|uniref:GPN-loop GTPase 1-like n=1 Tax=Pseudopipra pipra TaxID=415032 RepID=UPI003139C59F
MEKRPKASRDVLLDPPGQTEVSASGAILTEAPAPCFPSVAVDVPDASGRTNPVAFMSNVLCCVCLQTECTPFIHLFREYRPEYERLRKTLNPHVNLCLREKAQNKQKREQLEHLWKDMGSVCVQGSTLAELPREEILQRGFPPDKP